MPSLFEFLSQPVIIILMPVGRDRATYTFITERTYRMEICCLLLDVFAVANICLRCAAFIADLAIRLRYPQSDINVSFLFWIVNSTAHTYCHLYFHTACICTWNCYLFIIFLFSCNIICGHLFFFVLRIAKKRWHSFSVPFKKDVNHFSRYKEYKCVLAINIFFKLYIFIVIRRTFV